MTANHPNPTTIALVTGANKGIGREIAGQLAALGMTVLLGARDPGLGAVAAEELRATGGDVRPVALDVTDPATVRAAATYVEETFGRLDVLVNNAGITGATAATRGTDAGRQTPSRADLDVVRRVFETNVFGVITVTNALLPLLLRSAAPRVVNVSSGVGSLGELTDPTSPLAAIPAGIAYPTSKTALNAVTVQYAREFRDAPIRFNAADPGYCATDLNGHTGYRTAAQGAAVSVRLATLGPDGPTGGFFDDEGPVRW
ncbi:SDR family oxidoreductase [Micromonospora sp. NPDC049559]|uniref:SDR family oxidoreductase n=1 Tax=Micromonospora sp. NPDC049559 TaxID=3155923 RepID=UPI0034457B83